VPTSSAAETFWNTEVRRLLAGGEGSATASERAASPSASEAMNMRANAGVALTLADEHVLQDGHEESDTRERGTWGFDHSYPPSGDQSETDGWGNNDVGMGNGSDLQQPAWPVDAPDGEYTQGEYQQGAEQWGPHNGHYDPAAAMAPQSEIAGVWSDNGDTTAYDAHANNYASTGGNARVNGDPLAWGKDAYPDDSSNPAASFVDQYQQPWQYDAQESHSQSADDAAVDEGERRNPQEDATEVVALPPPGTSRPSSNHSQPNGASPSNEPSGLTNPFAYSQSGGGGFGIQSPFGITQPGFAVGPPTLPSLDDVAPLSPPSLMPQGAAETHAASPRRSVSSPATVRPAPTRKEDEKSTSGGLGDNQPRRASTSGGWLTGLVSAVKNVVSDPKAMKLDSGPAAFEWDETLKAHVPTDPEERREWLAEREKMSAPPPPTAAMMSAPGTPAMLGQPQPRTPLAATQRKGLTDPLATLDVGTPGLRSGASAKRNKKRTYAPVPGLSPSANTGSPLGGPVGLPPL
jgi:hypothetical protein